MKSGTFWLKINDDFVSKFKLRQGTQLFGTLRKHRNFLVCLFLYVVDLIERRKKKGKQKSEKL